MGEGLMKNYFDSCSSYPVLPEIVERLTEKYKNFYANPFSQHGMGVKCRKLLEESRHAIQEITHCSPNSIYFTSGATESLNLIIKGYAAHLEQLQVSEKEVIISPIEHLSVYNPILALGKRGWNIKILEVDENGQVIEERLRSLLSDRTKMVCIIADNNEVGIKQEIDRLSRIVKEYNEKIFFLTDSAQAIGKTVTGFSTDSVDAFIISGQKIGAPRGIGCFYLNRRVRIQPLFHGGGHEQGYRSGTTDPILASTLSHAVTFGSKHLNEHLDIIKGFNKLLEEELTRLGISFTRQVPFGLSNPYICSMSFSDIKNGHLIQGLSKNGFYVSGGSACTSVCGTKSRVLEAMGSDYLTMTHTIRISFSIFNTVSSVKNLAHAISGVIEAKKAKELVY